MKVKLNAFRGDDRPGDVVDIPDAEAAQLLAHGAAHPADGGKTKPAARQRRTVRGEAALQASSETQGDEAHGQDSAAP